MTRRNSARQTLENLREIGTHVADAAKRALRNGAYAVAADAKSRAPVKTGKLRDSIKVTGNSNGAKYKISADAANNGYRYGKIVEFRPGHERPFLYPALDAKRQQIRNDIADAIRNAVNRGH